MNSKASKLEAFGRLLDVMDELREKCPWDQKQTFETLRHLTIEETYELGDAILNKDLNEIKKELGDLLLHIVFYAKLGSEENAFDIADVTNDIIEKLIYRHPHIYGDVSVSDADEVKKNWEALKLSEGKESVLEGVPKGLPALIKAQRMQEKAAGVGFDWNTKDQVWSKFEEELGELDEALLKNDTEAIEAEFGDVLFSLINYARFLKINPESALERTNQKFIQRFQFIEAKAKAQSSSIEKLSLDEMEILWQQAKN
ncbi:MAG: nucleoside triphosphate pyrophosphohydrolase [Flavobacteriaceae bacterium]|jgi:XTP/dITP diphosphohydrolase|nr:nucleoside triphosphate pyrophosphohydrolase [Flavobacteriaceae bacterium]MDC1543821.1 nucleoside triphosphate pyrophosphohydrolase [Flavobacteriaceae bacterium]MDO7570103.1 nucleoside triphosphate pyrophosphohydrolase [Flavobacteriaceae bacterium]MDO7576692.1 nucleoside triphosphate pyrophosphohydrolase [Flavobacteriaceae bacterium]